MNSKQSESVARHHSYRYRRVYMKLAIIHR